MRPFWPATEGAQADYETLRAAAVSDARHDGLAAQRFARRGLAGLIAWPSSEPVFIARLIGAERPAWTPHTDPRQDALAAGYELLVATTELIVELREARG